jgi:hypothetical protein
MTEQGVRSLSEFIGVLGEKYFCDASHFMDGAFAEVRSGSMGGFPPGLES